MSMKPKIKPISFPNYKNDINPRNNIFFTTYTSNSHKNINLATNISNLHHKNKDNLKNAGKLK